MVSIPHRIEKNCLVCCLPLSGTTFPSLIGLRKTNYINPICMNIVAVSIPHRIEKNNFAGFHVSHLPHVSIPHRIEKNEVDPQGEGGSSPCFHPS